MHTFCVYTYTLKPTKMKNIIIAAFLIAIGLVGCSVSQPGERDYYPPQPGYSTTYGTYDPYYNPGYDNSYSIQRVYDRNTGRYYDVKVYNTPMYDGNVYNVPAYPNYRREREREYYNQQREQQYREQQYRQQREQQYRQQQGTTTQPQPAPNYQQQDRRLPDGTRISPDGTVTRPNGEVIRK